MGDHALAPARLTDEAAGAERRARKRIGPTTLYTSVEPGPVAERLDVPHPEADRHPRRLPRTLKGTKTADQEAEEGDVTVALRAHSRHTPDDPRRLREDLERLAHAVEG